MVIFSVRRLPGVSASLFPLLFAGLIAVVLPGCKQSVSDPNDPKFIVAEKGTWTVTRDELNKEVANFLKQQQLTAEQVGPSKMPMVETVTLKNIVLKKLLLDKASTEPAVGLDKTEQAQFNDIQGRVPPGQDLATLLKSAGLSVDDLKKQIHEKVLVENVLKNEAFKNVDPSEQEIDAIYVKNKDKFDIPAKIRASRILIHVDPSASMADKAADKKLIDAAHARVMHGEDFGKVAAAVSQDQSSAPKGGDLGYFARGENPDAGFDEVVFATKQNTVSPVFMTPLGYQFVKVTAIQPAGVVPVADARSYIASQLKAHNMETAAKTYASSLLANSGVTYHLVLVDPPAQMQGGAPGAGAGAGAGPAPDAGQPGDQDQGQPMESPTGAPSTEPPPAQEPATGAPADTAPAPASATSTPSATTPSKQ